MGLFNGNSGKTRDEQRADNNRHRALKKAGEAAARKHPDKHVVHDQINEAIIENEKHVSWWLR